MLNRASEPVPGPLTRRARRKKTRRTVRVAGSAQWRKW